LWDAGFGQCLGERGSGSFDVEERTPEGEGVGLGGSLNEEFDGGGRVLVRPSGTEPALRVMVEGPDADLVSELADSIAALAGDRLN